MESQQSSDPKQAQTLIKSLSDPVEHTDAKMAKSAAADVAVTHQTMIQLPNSPKPQADEAKQ